jgi:hypothetical protein
MVGQHHGRCSLGDVTGCSLSVIVPCHGHLATWHGITVFIGEVLFCFSVLEVFFHKY